MSTIPQAEPDPGALYVLTPRTREVPTTGCCAFGAGRLGARRTVGVTLHWPLGARVQAPLPGRLLPARSWSFFHEEKTYILYLRGQRYTFGFGNLLLDTWRHPGAVDRGTEVAFNRRASQLHVSMYELPERLSDEDFLCMSTVWRDNEAAPPHLVDPTAFLQAAAKGWP